MFLFPKRISQWTLAVLSVLALAGPAQSQLVYEPLPAFPGCTATPSGRVATESVSCVTPALAEAQTGAQVDTPGGPIILQPFESVKHSVLVTRGDEPAVYINAIVLDPSPAVIQNISCIVVVLPFPGFPSFTFVVMGLNENDAGGFRNIDGEVIFTPFFQKTFRTTLEVTRADFGYEASCLVDWVRVAQGDTTVITSDRVTAAGVLVANGFGDIAASALFEVFHYSTPKDDDGDGTLNSDDVCPETPLGERVVPRADAGGGRGCSLSQLTGQ